MGNIGKIRITKWKINAVLLMIYDSLTIAFSFFLGLWLRFDFVYSQIPSKYLKVYGKIVAPYVLLCIVVYYFSKMYSSIWTFASYNELYKSILSSLGCGIIQILACIAFGARMPISYYLVGIVSQIIFCVSLRFSYRFYVMVKRNRKAVKGNLDRVMIIGAGDAGIQLLKDVNKNDKTNNKVICFIDDDSNKQGRYIEGIPVVGGKDDILFNVNKYHIEKIFFAIPTATTEQKREILHICKETGCEIKILPGLYQIVNGEVTVGIMKDVAIEDLLGRDVIRVSNSEINNFISNKTVLVTGGGGSIGSELCRQIAKNNPKQLIIFDIYENNAYDIEQELKRKYPDLNLLTLIGSVRDSKRVDYVFDKYRPEIVYHAAAHKHVPLMETSPCEAIKNNTIGTFKVAYASIKYGVSRFVLISTDKAVNPTNIMGATKRTCEMIIQTFDRLVKNGETHKLSIVEDCFSELSSKKLENKTEFVAVRFGNVLGSNGSVIPLFKKQIEAGGPVTVTHPDIIRYFMTIPEAVSLVLQAGVYAKGGEIFILDMGEPVKIDSLARNLIRLSGYKPDEDIKIVYTGLRPGEKLYEEKLMAAEGNKKTDNDLIYVGMPLEINEDEFLEELKNLYAVAIDNNEEETINNISKIVSTYVREGC